eukprot:1010022-Prymnesium_polylepis.1
MHRWCALFLPHVLAAEQDCAWNDFKCQAARAQRAISSAGKSVGSVAQGLGKGVGSVAQDLGSVAQGLGKGVGSVAQDLGSAVGSATGIGLDATEDLKLCIVGASGLKKEFDKGWREHPEPDPFVKAMSPGHFDCQTPFIANTPNPVWNYCCDYKLPRGTNFNFTFELYDDDVGTAPNQARASLTGMPAATAPGCSLHPVRLPTPPCTAHMTLPPSPLTYTHAPHSFVSATNPRRWPLSCDGIAFRRVRLLWMT